CCEFVPGLPTVMGYGKLTTEPDKYVIHRSDRIVTRARHHRAGCPGHAAILCFQEEGRHAFAACSHRQDSRSGIEESWRLNLIHGLPGEWQLIIRHLPGVTAVCGVIDIEDIVCVACS